jgi:hypothetical protein
MLTKEQIEYLFAFCRQHFVQYYEVQIELVDHLANAVEVEMANDPKLSFENAVEKVHRSFGVMGFAPLVSEKRKIAEKQSWKLFWRVFREQFKWPKILTFFLLTALSFTLFSAVPFLIKLIFFVTFIGSWIFHFISMRRLQKLISRSGKKFLILNVSWFSSFSLFPIYLFNFSNFYEEVFNYSSSLNYIPIISIFFSLYITLIIVTLQSLSTIKSTLFKNYPEVFTLAQ